MTQATSVASTGATPRGWFARGVDPVATMRTSQRARQVVAVAIGLYIVVYGALSVGNYLGFNVFGFDFGIFDQGVWLLSRFQEPFVTVRGLHLFGDHTSFILLPLVPLYWVFPSGVVLMVAQAVAIGVAALPVFLLGRDLIGDERPAAAVAVVFLLQPALGWTNLENFHPDSFEVPLLTFALWFMVRQRWRWYFVSIGLLLLVKEDVALLTFVLGIYVAVRYSKKMGIITSAVSVGYFLFAVYVVLAFFGEGTLYAGRIPFGGVGGLMSTLFTEPGDVLSYLLSDGRPWYLWTLLAPLALLPLLAPEVMLIAIGPLGSNLVSTFGYQHQIRYHYDTLILPVLALATITALARMKGRTRVVAWYALVWTVLMSAFWWGPLPGSMRSGPSANPGSPIAVSARAAIELIPDDAVVSSHYRFISHLVHRTHIYEYPNPYRATNWGNGDLNGQRLPQADTVEYLILPPESALSDVDGAVFEDIRDDYVVIHEDDHLMLLRARRLATG